MPVSLAMILPLMMAVSGIKLAVKSPVLMSSSMQLLTSSTMISLLGKVGLAEITDEIGSAEGECVIFLNQLEKQLAIPITLAGSTTNGMIRHEI